MIFLLWQAKKMGCSLAEYLKLQREGSMDNLDRAIAYLEEINDNLKSANENLKLCVIAIKEHKTELTERGLKEGSCQT